MAATLPNSPGSASKPGLVVMTDRQRSDWNADDDSLDDPAEPDRIPEDLLPESAGPYVFPDVSRRRIAGFFYAFIGVGLLAGWWFFPSPYSNVGLLAAGVFSVSVAAYSFAAGWRLKVDEMTAVEEAGAAVGFPLGPASVSIAWRGLLSRPVWRILCYSPEVPPERRGLAIVDAVDGKRLEVISEVNPEEWPHRGDSH